MNISKNQANQGKNVLLKGRVKAIDTARGYATIFMVIGHFIHGYLTYSSGPSWLHYLFVSLLGISAQNIFITLPGIGLALQMYVSRGRGTEENNLRKAVLKRGFILIILQFMFNLFYDWPYYTWTWFILSFIGTSIIICYFLSKFTIRFRMILIFVIILVSPFIKYYLLPINYANNYTLYPWTIGNYVYNMLFAVTFPIFPCICYPIFGTIFGEKIIEAKETNSMDKLIKNSFISGLIFILAYFFLQNLGDIINYPFSILTLPSRYDVFHVFGTFLIIISIFLWIQDYKNKDLAILKPFEIFGAITTTVFITHYYIFPKFWYPILKPDTNLTIYSIFGMTFILFLFYIIYGLVVQRYKRKYSFEWLIRSFI